MWRIVSMSAHPDLSDGDLREEARIREAYRRRFHASQFYTWFDPSYVFMLQQLERRTLQALGHCGISSLAARKVLEIGCGDGHWLREFIKWGANPEDLTGVDLLPDRIATGRRLTVPGVTLVCGNAAEMKLPDSYFDIVFQFTVFTSILDRRVKAQISSEMLRVLKPNGLVLWYDFFLNNPRNPDVRGIKRREIGQLFPGCRIHLEKITLAPPVSRRLAPRTWLGAYVLSTIPWLCSHYLGTIHKPA
jgi:SAM-dependent methyltransferase